MNKKIPFSPPDITEAEINAVVNVLRSGWITSGPKTAEFGEKIAEYCGTNHAIALANATAGLEILLQVFHIKSGDDVITTPYTYTSTASASIHRGILPTFVDVKKDDFLIDPDKLYDAIKPNTKAIYSVDFAGVPVDYDAIHEVLKAKNRKDILLVSDSAHAFGAAYKGKKVGSQVDAHVFSFHAVKNLTTAEGGAVTFNNNHLFGKKDLLKDLKLMSLNGQSKDALSKTQAGAWKYDVLFTGAKCNMTDINAAIGLVQLSRYENMLKKRKTIFDIYTNALKGKDWAIIPFENNELDKKAIEDASDYNFFNCLKNINGNVLILHGTDDESVPPLYSKKIERLLGNKALLQFITGADHCYSSPFYYQQLVQKIVCFTKKHILY